MGLTYGDWSFVTLNVFLFGCFLIFFLIPKKTRDWLSLGVTQAFFVAFFTEMYGVPFTLYLLSSIFTFKITGSNPILGLWGLSDYAQVFWWFGVVLVLMGLSLVFLGWREIYFGGKTLVRWGIYKYSRHPQYLGIVLLSTGFLTCWPTLLTLVMWPFLVLAYYRLAKLEEREMTEKFGKLYENYKREVPMFLGLAKGARKHYS